MSDTESSNSYNSSETSGQSDFDNFTLKLFGRVIDNYHFITKLGNGAYAEVWMAYNHIKDDFVAVKVQNHDSYQEARDEVKLLKQLNKAPYTSHLIESFIVKDKDNKYYAMVFPLFGNNLDRITRYDKYNDGLPEKIVLKFLKQSIQALEYLHKKLNVIHCDIKPENFMVSTLTTKSKEIIRLYNSKKFRELYNSVKKELKEDVDDKKIREKIHQQQLKNLNDLPSSFSEETIADGDFYLADFGGFCHIDEKYDEDYGTRYYRAPENILVSEDMDYKVDIWSLGCTLYELLTNKVLFNPDKDKKFDRDYYHLAEIFLLGKMSNKEIKSCNRRKEFFHKDGTCKDLPTENLTQVKERLEELPKYWEKLLKGMLTPSFKKRFSITEIKNFINSLENQLESS